MTDYFYNNYGLPNIPPGISDMLPTGLNEYPDVNISFRVTDPRGEPDPETLNVVMTLNEFVAGPKDTLTPIVDGVFQSGFSGSITIEEGGNFDVVIDPDSMLAEGAWIVYVTMYDDNLPPDLGSGSWEFGVENRPRLLGARALSRRLIEVEFDSLLGGVRTRASNLANPQPTEPEFRYVQNDWVALGGYTWEAANPTNYSIARPEGGNLSGPAEAIDLTPIWAGEYETYYEEAYGAIMAYKVIVKTDFNMTARASYEITISGIKNSELGTAVDPATYSFDGYIPSQVPRESLVLYDTLPGVVRRKDFEGTGDLEKIFTAFQEVFNRLVEDIDAFFADLCEIDRVRSDVIDAVLYDLGNPFQSIFVLNTQQKRKLLSVLVQMYRGKGTCEGIVNVVRFFLGVELLGCTRPWQTVWQLDKGTYPSPVGPNDELGSDTYLGPGIDSELNSFFLLHASPGSISSDDEEKIGQVVEYMKPAGSYYLGIKAP